MHDRPRRIPSMGWVLAVLVLAAIGIMIAAAMTGGSRAPTARLVQATTTTAPASATPTRPPVPYPGAAYLVEGGELPDVPYRPSASDAKDDQPVVYKNGCHQRNPATVLSCEFGPDNARRTIVLVGDSKSAQWLPALQAVADEYSWRIVSMTKSGCRFKKGYAEPDDELEQSCVQWNRSVLERLRSMRPDLIVTGATRGSGGIDYLPSNNIDAWWEANALGLPIIAIRDNAWLHFDVARCVAEYGPDARRCGADRAEHGLNRPIAIPAGRTVPPNTHLVDFTDYYCLETFCPAVIGNVLVYRDDNHLTATYVATMGPYLAREIVRIMGWVSTATPS